MAKRLLILPRDRSAESYIYALPHGRLGHSVPYFIDPQHGIYELTQFDGGKHSCYSWLVTDHMDGVGTSREAGTKAESTGRRRLASQSAGNVPLRQRPQSGHFSLKDSSMYVATKMDLLFLVLPALAPRTNIAESEKGHYLTLEDYIENLGASGHELDKVLSHPRIRSEVLKRLRHISDSVDVGDEHMYRLNMSKLLDHLLQKAKRMVEAGLPPSLDAEMVKRPLDAPMVDRPKSVADIEKDDPQAEDEEPEKASNIEPDCAPEQHDSNPCSSPMPRAETKTTLSLSAQTSSCSSASVMSNSTAPTSMAKDLATAEISPELLRLQRIRIAMRFMLCSYIPRHIATALEKLMQEKSCSVNFQPLDTYLDELQRLREQALSARSIGDFSRKRNMHEDDDAAVARAEKKAKADELEKKRRAESRGVKNLRKADTSGMKKMSSFFTKVTVTKKVEA